MEEVDLYFLHLHSGICTDDEKIDAWDSDVPLFFVWVLSRKESSRV